MDETIYYQHQDGAVTVRTVTLPEGAERPEPPAGAAEITAAQYEAARAELAEAHEEHVAELERGEAEAAEEDYEALIATGVPDATARRLTGHQPEPAKRAG